MQYFCIWVDFKHSTRFIAFKCSAHAKAAPPPPPYPPPPPPFTHNAFTTRLLYQKVTETFHEALKTMGKKNDILFGIFFQSLPLVAIGH